MVGQAQDQSRRDKPTDQAPFVAVPVELLDLVLNGDLTRHAAWLYVILLRHYNRKRADNDVWPSRTALAAALGLSKPESVDGYLAELRKIGLITVTERRRAGKMRASNRYTLHLLADLRTPEQRASQPPGETGVSAGQSDTPNLGVRYPPQGVSVTPHRGQEPEEPQLDEHQPDQEDRSSLSNGHTARVSTAASVPQQREREDAFSNRKYKSIAHKLIASYGWNEAWQDWFVDQLEWRNDVNNMTAWAIAADRNGSLLDCMQEAMDDYNAEHGTRWSADQRART